MEKEMVKWEYTWCSDTRLEELGKEGWEAVGFYYYGGYTILMKRPIVSN